MGKVRRLFFNNGENHDSIAAASSSLHQMPAPRRAAHPAVRPARFRREADRDRHETSTRNFSSLYDETLARKNINCNPCSKVSPNKAIHLIEKLLERGKTGDGWS